MEKKKEEQGEKSAEYLHGINKCAIYYQASLRPMNIDCVTSFDWTISPMAVEK